MTSKQELGEMLITGKQIDESIKGKDNWFAMDHNDPKFDLEYFEYRLAPKTTYYRVWQRAGADHVAIDHQTTKFNHFANWRQEPDIIHIHDFEITE